MVGHVAAAPAMNSGENIINLTKQKKRKKESEQ
jgi:hypothetical protein